MVRLWNSAVSGVLRYLATCFPAAAIARSTSGQNPAAESDASAPGRRGSGRSAGPGTARARPGDSADWLTRPACSSRLHSVSLAPCLAQHQPRAVRCIAQPKPLARSPASGRASPGIPSPRSTPAKRLGEDLFRPRIDFRRDRSSKAPGAPRRPSASVPVRSLLDRPACATPRENQRARSSSRNQKCPRPPRNSSTCTTGARGSTRGTDCDHRETDTAPCTCTHTAQMANTRPPRRQCQPRFLWRIKSFRNDGAPGSS